MPIIIKKLKEIKINSKAASTKHKLTEDLVTSNKKKSFHFANMQNSLKCVVLWRFITTKVLLRQDLVLSTIH